MYVQCQERESIQTQATTLVISVLRTARIRSNGYLGTTPSNNTGKSICNRDERQILQVNTSSTNHQDKCDASCGYFPRPLNYTIWHTTIWASRQRPEFVSTFFVTIGEFNGAKYLTRTAYHPQTKRQVERYNKAIVTWLRYYVADYLRHWDTFVHPLLYAYNMKVHRITSTSAYRIV